MTYPRLASLLASIAALALFPSCSQTPANVAGNWSVNLTNGANGCMVSSWTPGETASAIPLTITQSGSSITAVVGGTTAILTNAAFGTATFTGTVDGNRLDARLTGRPAAMGSCAYTPVLDLSATLSGDTMNGTLVWSNDTNASADCGMLATCESEQAMNGSRPPTAP